MVFSGSRYEKSGTYTVTRSDGTTVTALRLPLPAAPVLQGFYPRRADVSRLDLVAAHFLKDATAFWRLCDANDAVSPDALAAHDLIGIPPAGR
jgi:hypothetical protein